MFIYKIKRNFFKRNLENNRKNKNGLKLFLVLIVKKRFMIKHVLHVNM